MLIVLNFLMVISSAQFNPKDEDNTFKDVIAVLEYSFTFIFIIELMANMISFWFKLFWMYADMWNALC